MVVLTDFIVKMTRREKYYIGSFQTEYYNFFSFADINVLE